MRWTRAEDAKTDVIFNLGSILFPISESPSNPSLSRATRPS